MTDSSESNYVPKFIQNVPWYYKLKNQNKDDQATSDSYAHQRKLESTTKSSALASVAVTTDASNETNRGQEDYESKRDRWQGHAEEQWDEIVGTWESNKGSLKFVESNQDDSDDTEYELELQDLGLERWQLKSNRLGGNLSNSHGDQSEIPNYILGITANEGGKVRYGIDSLAAIINQDSEFVREKKDEEDFKKIQAFAWEKNRQHEKEQQMKQFYSEVNGEQNGSLTQANLDYVVEASPTLLMMRAREKEKKAKEESEKKMKKLMEKYGS